MAPTVHACNKCFVSAEGKQGAHARSLFLGRLRFSAAGAPPPPSPLLAALPAGGAACALRAGHCLAPGCCKAAGATLGASITCAARFAQQESPNQVSEAAAQSSTVLRQSAAKQPVRIWLLRSRRTRAPALHYIFTKSLYLIFSYGACILKTALRVLTNPARLLGCHSLGKTGVQCEA